MSGGRLALAGRRRERHEARSRIEKPGYAVKIPEPGAHRRHVSEELSMHRKRYASDPAGTSQRPMSCISIETWPVAAS
jgi:hypothetical protein